MNLHAVVVNYRTSADLDRFLQTWTEHQPSHQWNLVVANVDPLDADLRVAENYSDPLVTHTVHDQNVGYARACNAAAYGDADVFAFFNADVWFRGDAVERVMLAMEDNPDWGVVGPRQVDSHNRLTHAGIFGTNRRPQMRAWHLRADGEYVDVSPAVTVSGAAYFVKAEAWWQLTNCETYQQSASSLGIGPAAGAFLPTPHYYEETWCSYHASAHGWPVMYFGQATMVHEWHKASAMGVAERQMPESRRLFRAACADHGIECD